MVFRAIKVRVSVIRVMSVIRELVGLLELLEL